jgi:Adenosine deaminase
LRRPLQVESRTEAAQIVAEIARGGLAELHTHLGGSVDPAVMWTLAHEQGISLPVKDYWEFVELVTVDPRGVEGLPSSTRSTSGPS